VQSIGELAAMDLEVDCILLDLGLPDAAGLEALHKARTYVTAAVVVLTGRADESAAIEAVAAGAEEYLLKADLDGPTLVRSIRFAIERRRADLAEVRAAVTARMAEGLFADPLVTDPRVRWTRRYQPGGEGALLGGDFIDLIELDDGWLHLIVGDVAGHGPEEAAIGVSLRMSWRALALAGHDPTDTFHHVNALLNREWKRRRFATACQVSVAPDRRRARIILAGHPPPLRVDGGISEVPVERRGLPLGISTSETWEAEEVELGDDWALLVYTDGLVEGLCGDGRQRWGIEGLTAAAGEGGATDPDEFVDRLLQTAEARNGAPLGDDVALLLLRVGGDR
jgi:CheY-like chemotaxis protein